MRCLWELQAEGNALAEPIFPDGCIEVIVHLADRPRERCDGRQQPRAMIVGQMLTATHLDAQARTHAVGVRFTPAGARAWLGLPLHQITGRIEDAGAVCGAAASRLQSTVEQARGVDERLAAAERTIRATLRPQSQATEAVRRAVWLIHAGGGIVRADAVARACGISPRHLERCFQEHVGLSPKALARIVRFQRSLRELRAGRALATVAASCDFADQAHLAREFRRFAGVPARDVNLADVAFVQDASHPRPAHC